MHIYIAKDSKIVILSSFAYTYLLDLRTHHLSLVTALLYLRITIINGNHVRIRCISYLEIKKRAGKHLTILKTAVRNQSLISKI